LKEDDDDDDDDDDDLSEQKDLETKSAISSVCVYTEENIWT
jgi:hypothetical protein